MGHTPSFSFSSPRPQRTYSTSSQQQLQPITLPPTQPGKTPPGPPPLPLPAPTSSSSPPLTLSLSLPAPAPAAPNDPWILKDNHTTVSIKIRRPAPVPVPAPIPPAPHAPLETRSPPSMRLPAFPDSKHQQKQPGKGAVPPPGQKENEREVAKTGAGVGTEKEKGREEKGRAMVVKRTREEEKKAYGRVFAGCGQKDDYNILTKLGEGTFGEVHKAMHKKKMSPVAIKRILMHNEKEGMPVTALREIKILKALTHPCIVELWDMFVVPSQGRDHPMSVYMVFPYMDHDLAGLLENERVHLSPSQIKLYMKQLLEGTEYMHHNHILHRDMKAANLLISNAGTLKIADFGLARSFDPSITTKKGKFGRNGHERRYTNCVVTRWYRPPELLLGAKQYGGEIDLWGIGCVLGEMFSRRPILTGNSDLDQLEKIFQLCGSPNQQNWPDFDMLPGCEGQIRFPAAYSRRIKIVYDSVGKETADLLDKLLTLDPRERITATQALDHAYFWTDPLPADPKSLPTYDSSHEYDQRGRPYQQQPHQPSHLRNAPYGQPQPPPQPPPSSLPPPIHLQPNGSRNWPGQGHGPGPGPGPHPHFQRNGPGPGGPPLRDRDRERDRDRWVPQPQSQGPNDRPPSLPARPPVDLPARPSLPPPRGKGGGVMMGYPPPPPAPWDTRGDRDGAASSGGLNYG
ncbi:Pkinase-domain-containing protein [Rickenella mellea]|uniref:Pkinase-domain-containing protein n=1 Tax=Rickenella mellea TaxID=50990 RepID=A0A4Y7Q3T8_9AGAM|nr:Pkinase-domain-containing protein [Rickenella mellea]